jgi:hypothetical protein
LDKIGSLENERKDLESQLEQASAEAAARNLAQLNEDGGGNTGTAAANPAAMERIKERWVSESDAQTRACAET